MNDLLKNVERAAAAKFANPDTTEEIQAAAIVAKTIAEANKAKIDAQNKLRELHLERLKSWSVALVPIVSLLTLLGTVIVQAYQLRQQSISARSQSEDVEWRELLKSLGGRSSSDYASDITVSSRLQAFMNSDRYKEQARRLAVRVMGNLTNVNAFTELLDATVQFQSEDELKMLLGIARVLNGTKISLDSECYTEAVSLGVARDLPFGVCTWTLPQENAIELARKVGDGGAKAALERRQSTYVVHTQIATISTRISSILRERYSVGTKSSDDKPVDLSNLTLVAPDLSQIDFSRFNPSNTVIRAGKLDGAVLTVITNFMNFDLSDSEWWNATSIEQKFLQWLIENRFPYYTPGITYPSGEVTRAFYESRVQALCTSQMAACKPPLRFTPFPEDGSAPGFGTVPTPTPITSPAPPATDTEPLPGR
jgi:hypothetical protein